MRAALNHCFNPSGPLACSGIGLWSTNSGARRSSNTDSSPLVIADIKRP
ncbi:MAG: hypothetical protein M3P93_04455 [Actinomycetota bacterium]|nr:hypothetical protein [Actinomycetota bacterium]